MAIQPSPSDPARAPLEDIRRLAWEVERRLHDRFRMQSILLPDGLAAREGRVAARAGLPLRLTTRADRSPSCGTRLVVSELTEMSGRFGLIALLAIPGRGAAGSGLLLTLRAARHRPLAIELDVPAIGATGGSAALDGARRLVGDLCALGRPGPIARWRRQLASPLQLSRLVRSAPAPGVVAPVSGLLERSSMSRRAARGFVTDAPRSRLLRAFANRIRESVLLQAAFGANWLSRYVDHGILALVPTALDGAARRVRI